ncbi:MAG: chemotaxis protein CheB [bacterium]
MTNHEIVVIGTSLGGLQALKILLSGLPKGFPLPIVIVQHRKEGTEDILTGLLQKECELPVIEPEDKMEIEPGKVYIAPCDYHLLVERGSFAFSVEAKVLGSRPSIDVLFESAADAYAERTIGIILTGNSKDGACGLARIKERGGLAVVQEPASAEAEIMPDAAIRAVKADKILPLSEISCYLTQLIIGYK